MLSRPEDDANLIRTQAQLRRLYDVERYHAMPDDLDSLIAQVGEVLDRR